MCVYDVIRCVYNTTATANSLVAGSGSQRTSSNFSATMVTSASGMASRMRSAAVRPITPAPSTQMLPAEAEGPPPLTAAAAAGAAELARGACRRLDGASAVRWLQGAAPRRTVGAGR